MKIIQELRITNDSRRGGAMVLATLAITIVSVLAMSMVTIQASGSKELHRSQEETRAVLAAEAGLSRSYMLLQNGGSGDLGSANQPLNLSSGEVSVDTQTFGPTNKLLRVTSTSRVGSSDASAELILQDNSTAFFVWGAFGDTSLKMNSQGKIDSYDSVLGTYQSQVVNGSGGNAWANDEGNIGSNGNIELKQNALVKGNAIPGQSSTISVIGNASVSGSTANAGAAVSLPPIVVPSIPSSGNRTFSVNTSLAAGNYHFGRTVINGTKTVTVTGPATLVFDSFEMKSNSNFRIDSSAGEVQIYVIDNFIMNSNTLLASLDYDPRDVHVNLLSDNIIDPGIVVKLDDVLLNSNGRLFGTIYAPDARVDIESNFEVFGAVVAEEVILSSNSRVHYDEALGRILAPGAQRYTLLTWRAMH
ncbi:MAG: hypothetical protein ABI054_03715 [Planctomycetota bacterium]